MSNSTEHLVYTRESARRIDEEAFSIFGIPGIVLMENTARGIAEIAHRLVVEQHGSARILLASEPGTTAGMDGQRLVT